MSRPAEIEVNSASLVGLKAELFRKQEEFNRSRLTGQRPPVKKPPPLVRNKGVDARASKDAQATVSLEERNRLEESRRKLEAKAAVYDRLVASGVDIEDDDEGEHFLVDFQRKGWNEPPPERRRSPSPRGTRSPPRGDGESVGEEIGEWVEYTDSLGRTRRCPRADLERLLAMDGRDRSDYDRSEGSDGGDVKRRRIERDEDDDKPVGPVHYQEVLGGEIRDHGVSYYRFSTDEATRQDQMKELDRLREQTIASRERRDRLKQKREEEKQARLDKIRAKRLAASGQAPLQPAQVDETESAADDDIRQYVRSLRPQRDGVP